MRVPGKMSPGMTSGPVVQLMERDLLNLSTPFSSQTMVMKY